MQTKKLILIILVGVLIIFSGIFFLYKNKTKTPVIEHFPNSTLPDKTVVVGDKFELVQGQRAIVANTNVSIRYTGVISTPPDIQEPIYDFVSNGSSISYTTSPYNVYVVFGSGGNSSAVFSVSSVESECQSGLMSEKDQCWYDLAGRTNDTSYCSNIVSEILRDSCINADILSEARETFFTQIVIISNPVVSPSTIANTVREICSGTDYSSGICRIVGETQVMTPQECLDSIPEGLGASFYEDCFSVSMYVYGPDADICALANPDELIESCLISAEQAKT